MNAFHILSRNNFGLDSLIRCACVHAVCASDRTTEGHVAGRASMADPMEERIDLLEEASTSHKMALDALFLLVCAVFVFGEQRLLATKDDMLLF